MKVDNQTDYDTRLLRTLLCIVHASESQGKLRWWDRVTVEIRYPRRGQRRQGWAYLNSTLARLYLPRDSFSIPWFLALWQHELWHLRGVLHKDMPPTILYSSADTPFVRGLVDKLDPKLHAHPHCRIAQHPADEEGDRAPTWRAFPVAKEAKAEPSKAEQQQTKVDRLLERRKRWLSKLRRATNAIEKIDRSLGYYRREGRDVPELEKPAKAASKRRKRRKR